MAFPPKSMADFGEFGKLFADMKLPAMPDMEAFVSASRRNMETLTAANRVALEGAQAGSGSEAHGNCAAKYSGTGRSGCVRCNFGKTAAGKGPPYRPNC